MPIDMQFTGNEMTFDDNTLLVSKTDPKGVIMYANREFFHIAKFSEEELVGRPHAVVRHPLMPKLVFQLLWESIKKQGGTVICQDEESSIMWGMPSSAIQANIHSCILPIEEIGTTLLRQVMTQEP